jgi:hypothetical protein
MRCERGTRTSANESSAVSLARQPVFFRLRETVKPGVPRSTTKNVRPPVGVLARARQHRHEVGPAAAGDEHLGAVDDVGVPVAHRAGADARDVAARARLGDGQRSDLLAAQHGGHPALLLCVVAEVHDGGQGDAVRRHPGDHPRRAAPDHLLQGQQRQQRALARAAEVLGEPGGQDARLGRAGVEFAGEEFGLFPRRGKRLDLRPREAAAGLLEGSGDVVFGMHRASMRSPGRRAQAGA